MSTALRPSVVECCRAVFAAFLWHEHLVKDAMAAAAYLKFHQHLHKLWSHSDVHEAAAPAALQPIIRLWIEVCTAVKGSVDQHLIVPPAGGRAFGSVTRKIEVRGHFLAILYFIVIIIYVIIIYIYISKTVFL
ncbi:unnamed protein product [Angiostrongylus costaricensis]|uniref:Uncharacterized protein n=1 Tax=Angiostrongylus costaricensis TaxID=334426 RepID=A0A0R3PIF5_ANGCS|nr:unnamed protein product [Angiostrongylus costaricensis]